MASRRATMSTSTLKNTSTDSKSSKTGNVKANNGGTAKKGSVKSSGTIVKSRYLQSLEKSTLSKSNSMTNEPVAVSPRPSSPKSNHTKLKVATPPRRSVAPIGLTTQPTPFGKGILQSTFSDGHCIAPNFDISSISEKTVMQNTVEPERNSESIKKITEIQTFLLAYLTAKMESNTAKMKAKAEAKVLEIMEEEEKLHNEVQEKKRKYLLMDRNRQMNELLDLQIAALTPMAENSRRFTKDYKSFAAAIDTTRHELPVKNYYIDGDRREFLDKAEFCLKKGEALLVECAHGDHQESSSAVECLRDMKMASKDIGQQLCGTLSELLELSSLVCRYTVHTQQAFEEEQLGTTRTQELYCPKQ